MKTDASSPAVTRRGFLATSGLLAGSATLLGQTAGTQAAAPQDQAFRLLSAPVLTNAASDAVSVLWATSAPATGWVEYGETEALGQRATGTDQGLLPYDERAFKIRLRDLKPATRYYYRVCAVRVDFRGPYDIRRLEQEADSSPVFSFTTPDPAAQQARFTVWNDTHEVTETLSRLHEAHEKTQETGPDDFLVWNGDQTNDISTEERMIAQLLAPAGQPFAARVPYYYVRGNHDVRGSGARRLPRFTDVPDGAYYYSFRRGPLAALVLDTGEDKPDDHPAYGGLADFAASRARQAEWLAREIEKPEFRDAPFKVLFCHIPLWWTREQSVGSYCADGRAKWHDLLVRAGVRLVISGHTHQPAWLPPEPGRPYGQLIAGGPKPAAATCIRGQATRDRLTITQHRLNGEVLHELEIAPA